jgi:hypothetical protein
MTATPVEITDDDLRELRSRLDDAQRVELTAASPTRISAPG